MSVRNTKPFDCFGYVISQLYGCMCTSDSFITVASTVQHLTLLEASTFAALIGITERLMIHIQFVLTTLTNTLYEIVSSP